ncbi:MAG: ShlB/FhaC/HecB family hemolysin secretion/activation protein [Woeseia sp.]
MNRLQISPCFSITRARKFRWIGTLNIDSRFAITILTCLITASPVLASENLGSAVIQNSSVYRPTELFDVYKVHLGKTVTEQTAATIAEALQQKYLADGYSRPGYRISDRGIDSGIVRIQLVEASISSVAINGNAGPYQEKLEQLVARLPSDRSLRPQEIKDALRSARRLPGLEVDVAAEPDGGHNGGFVLEVDSAYKPLEGNVRISNRGTREIDRDVMFAQLVANGLFSHENASGLFVTSAKDSDNYKGGGVFTNTALGAHGTSAQLQGAVTSLEYDVQGVQVEQYRERYRIQLMHPLRRQSVHELSVWAGFEMQNLDLAYNDATYREERLRSVELGSTLNWRNEETQYLLSIELEQGLNGLGSRIDSLGASDERLRKDFRIARLRWVRLAALNDLWSWRLDAYAQTSPHVLPSIKQFKVGGGRIGRGFEAAAISGDRGVGGKMQLQRRLASGVTWVERADLYGFYDAGSAWRHDLGNRESASSTGVGISMRDGRLSGYLEIAKPLTHADADGHKDAGLFAEVSFQF